MRTQNHSVNVGSAPYSVANVTGVLSGSWVGAIATTVSTATPLSTTSTVEPRQTDIPETPSGSLSSTPTESAPAFPFNRSFQGQSDSTLHGKAGREGALPHAVSPSPGNESKNSGSSSGIPAATGGSNINPTSFDFIKTALPLFKNMSRPEGMTSRSAPNPLASTLARDSMLAYARRIFYTPPVPGSVDGPSRVTDIVHIYRTQLQPLLENLRHLHPRHVPCLLLLGCVYHAIGHFAASLAINDELLEIDENFVSGTSRLGLSKWNLLIFRRLRPCPTRGRHSRQ